MKLERIGTAWQWACFEWARRDDIIGAIGDVVDWHARNGYVLITPRCVGLAFASGEARLRVTYFCGDVGEALRALPDGFAHLEFERARARAQGMRSYSLARIRALFGAQTTKGKR